MQFVKVESLKVESLSVENFNVAKFRVANIVKWVCCISILANLVACASMGAQDEDMVVGVFLNYTEREPGGESFKSRFFVSKEHMLISDDRNKNDFILLDRKAKTIYNVNSADQTILVVKNRPVGAKPPIQISYEEKAQPSGAIPKVGDKQATHYRYMANGNHCYDVVSLGEDFLPEVIQAMTEFRNILAGEHSKSVGSIPKDMLDACDLALNIYHPATHLQHGFPLREWDRRGYSRFIINYRANQKIQKDALNLPQGYKQYSIP